MGNDLGDEGALRRRPQHRGRFAPPLRPSPSCPFFTSVAIHHLHSQVRKYYLPLYYALEGNMKSRYQRFCTKKIDFFTFLPIQEPVFNIFMTIFQRKIYFSRMRESKTFKMSLGRCLDLYSFSSYFISGKQTSISPRVRAAGNVLEVVDLRANYENVIFFNFSKTVIQKRNINNFSFDIQLM